MSVNEASLQVEAARAGKMLGTVAMSFENITQYDGVLVQGKVAQEGEAISAAAPYVIVAPVSSALSTNISGWAAQQSIFPGPASGNAESGMVSGPPADSSLGRLYPIGWSLPSISLSLHGISSS